MIKKYAIGGVIIVGLIALSVWLLRPSVDAGYAHKAVTIGNTTFDALVADTEALRELGLGGRTGLRDDQAMLFIFDKPDFLGFWMKDMRFSIDMLWLDADFKIVSSASNVSPDTYPKSFFPPKPALYVIETNAGTLDRVGAQVGNIVKISE